MRTSLLGRILPRHLDNTYGGHRLAVWLLVPILFLKTGIALGTVFNGRVAAQSADGIPLETFGASAADTVLALFAIWGLSQLVFTVLGVLALVRYRAMIPLLFVLLVAEHLGRRLILVVMPIARTGGPPGLPINLALLALMVAGLALSLGKRSD